MRLGFLLWSYHLKRGWFAEMTLKGYRKNLHGNHICVYRCIHCRKYSAKTYLTHNEKWKNLSATALTTLIQILNQMWRSMESLRLKNGLHRRKRPEHVIVRPKIPKAGDALPMSAGLWTRLWKRKEYQEKYQSLSWNRINLIPVKLPFDRVVFNEGWNNYA